MNFYKELEQKFPIFLKNIGKEEHVKYASSIITCDADKCSQYQKTWEKAGIPFVEGAMIYLISKMSPYNKEARVNISVCDFVVKYYPTLKEYMP